MERNNNPQLELFTQGRENARKNGSGGYFLGTFLGYEKNILLIIVIAISSIISFSLGVERGKRVYQANSNTRMDLAAVKTEALQPKPATRPAPAKIIPNNIAEQPRVKEYILSYTIQLASYKTQSLAQREAQSLKKNGLSPLVLVKGGYTILCVGRFSNKEAARSLLSQLKKRYQDCYIRRL